jgi:hypothetical protein
MGKKDKKIGVVLYPTHVKEENSHLPSPKGMTKEVRGANCNVASCNGGQIRKKLPARTKVTNRVPSWHWQYVGRSMNRRQ